MQMSSCLKSMRCRFGFCVLNFLSTLSDLLSREKLSQMTWILHDLSHCSLISLIHWDFICSFSNEKKVQVINWFKLQLFTTGQKLKRLTKLQFLNIKIDQNTNFAKLQMPDCYFCTSLQVVYNCSGFGCSYFCVTFSHERNSELIERKFKTQNPIRRGNSYERERILTYSRKHHRS